MDLAVQVHNISYYWSSKAIYITAEVFEKKINDKSHRDIAHFNLVEKGNKISLKRSEISSEELCEILKDRILKFHVAYVEVPKAGLINQTSKFVFDSAQSCDILAAN